MISNILDIFLHLDVHLSNLTSTYGVLVYFILFFIIFCETGLVVTPFLPGDSLLFAAGALSALPQSGLAIEILFPLLVGAAFMGDHVNYTIGRWLGPKVFHRSDSLFLNQKYLEQSHQFYHQHGAKTVFLARFLPIFRTFAPFIAGIAKMKRLNFAMMSFFGSVTWMLCFLGSGYYFGNNTYVKSNFHIVIFAVIGVSFLPVVFGVAQRRIKSKQS